MLKPAQKNKKQEELNLVPLQALFSFDFNALDYERHRSLFSRSQPLLIIFAFQTQFSH